MAAGRKALIAAPADRRALPMSRPCAAAIIYAYAFFIAAPASRPIAGSWCPGACQSTGELPMNRSCASPLTPALSPGGGEGGPWAGPWRVHGLGARAQHVEASHEPCLCCDRPNLKFSIFNSQFPIEPPPGGFMGSGHGRGTWKLSMNRALALVGSAFHRVRDFSRARALAQARVLGGSSTFEDSSERCGSNAGTKEICGTRRHASLPGS